MVVTFCENCKNIMGFKYEDNKTVLECYSCLGNTSLVNSNTINTVYKESKITNEYPINLNTKYDRTLMRTRTLQCRNDECSSKNSTENPLVISYSRNNDLVQGYMCTQCDACWY